MKILKTTALSALLISTSVFAQTDSIAREYERYTESIYSAAENLNEVINGLADRNMSVIESGNMPVFSVETKTNMILQGENVLAEIMDLLAYMRVRIEGTENLVELNECRQFIATTREKANGFYTSLNEIRELDVNGEDRAEAFMAASLGFTNISMLGNEAVLGSTSLCVMKLAQ